MGVKLGCGEKEAERAKSQRKEGGKREIPFLFIFRVSKTIFKWILNSLFSFESNHSAQKLQCSNMYAHTCS
jgi:hypothetical protein